MNTSKEMFDCKDPPYFQRVGSCPVLNDVDHGFEGLRQDNVEVTSDDGVRSEIHDFRCQLAKERLAEAQKAWRGVWEDDWD